MAVARQHDAARGASGRLTRLATPRPHTSAKAAVTPRSRQCNPHDHRPAATSMTRPARRNRNGTARPRPVGLTQLRAPTRRSARLDDRCRPADARADQTVCARADACRRLPDSRGPVGSADLGVSACRGLGGCGQPCATPLSQRSPCYRAGGSGRWESVCVPRAVCCA